MSAMRGAHFVFTEIARDPLVKGQRSRFNSSLLARAPWRPGTNECLERKWDKTKRGKRMWKQPSNRKAREMTSFGTRCKGARLLLTKPPRAQGRMSLHKTTPLIDASESCTWGESMFGGKLPLVFIYLMHELVSFCLCLYLSAATGFGLDKHSENDTTKKNEKGWLTPKARPLVIQ